MYVQLCTTYVQNNFQKFLLKKLFYNFRNPFLKNDFSKKYSCTKSKFTSFFFLKREVYGKDTV